MRALPQKPVLKIGRGKLDSDQKLFVLFCIARFMAIDEIVEALERETGVSVRPAAISYYQKAPQWQPLISELRVKWLRDVKSIPIANPSWCLWDLQRIHDEAKRDGQKKLQIECILEAQKIVQPQRLHLQLDLGEEGQTSGVMVVSPRAESIEDWQEEANLHAIGAASESGTGIIGTE